MSIYEAAKKARFQMEFALFMINCGRQEKAADAFEKAFQFLEQIMEAESEEAAA